MKRICKISLGVVAYLHAFIPVCHAATVYLDNFDGDASAALIGTVPDVSAGPAWAGIESGAQWMSDGRITSSADESRYVHLPFSPVAGKIYKLEVEVSRIDTLHRFDFGFMSKAVGEGESFTQTDGLASPWMRMQGNGEVWTMLTKSGGAGQLAKVNPTRVQTLQIVLDTTATQWTVSWIAGGSTILTHTYPKNPQIQHVGFGRFRQGTFRIFRFELIEETPVSGS